VFKIKFVACILDSPSRHCP